MNVIESSEFRKRGQLLPGSQSRKDLQVQSLESLKRELDEENKKASRKARLVNLGILTGSVLLTLGLVLGNTTSNKQAVKGKKKVSDLKKLLRTIGYGLAVVGLIKGAGGMAENITVIESDGTITKGKDSRYSSTERIKGVIPDLRVKAVKVVCDLILKLKIMTSSELKNKSRSLRVNKPTGANKEVVNSIVEYGKQL